MGINATGRTGTSNDVHTPLRYPGGKSFLTGFLSQVYEANGIEMGIYAEPFAGGAGAAISLLLAEKVSHIYLNDANWAVSAFWKALLEQSERFVALVEETPVTLEEWMRQRTIFAQKNSRSNAPKDILELGFAMFYLNRCNRSGILNAGPIGGRTQEQQDAATYKIDARFNKPAILAKIKRIIRFRHQISVYSFDAVAFLNRVVNRFTLQKKRTCLVYLDPPYYNQGGNLYLNYYGKTEHAELRDHLLQERDYRWVLSYDNDKAIQDLYADFPLYEFDLFYSAHKSKEGKELLTHSKNLQLPDSNEVYRIRRHGKKVISLVSIEKEKKS